MAKSQPGDRELSTLRATAHPLRLRILSLLTGAEMSAAEVARELDLTHANASYHLRVLADAGEVVEAGRERIRGGVAKRYRHPWRELADVPGRDSGSPEAYVRAMTAELERRFGRRAAPGRNLLCDAEVWVSPQTWTRVLALVQEASGLVHGEARAPRSEGAVPVNLSIAAFAMTAAETPR